VRLSAYPREPNPPPQNITTQDDPLERGEMCSDVLIPTLQSSMSIQLTLVCDSLEQAQRVYEYWYNLTYPPPPPQLTATEVKQIINDAVHEAITEKKNPQSKGCTVQTAEQAWSPSRQTDPKQKQLAPDLLRCTVRIPYLSSHSPSQGKGKRKR